MELALARFNSEQKTSPVLQTRGEHIGKSGLPAPRRLNFAHGSLLLVPFTLWATDTVRVFSDFASVAPSLPITLLTSWAANSGSSDQPDPQALAGLRESAAQIPPAGTVLVVSDHVLQSFHLDVHPAAITLTRETLRVSTPLDNETAERMTLIPLGRVEMPSSTLSQSTSGHSGWWFCAFPARATYSCGSNPSGHSWAICPSRFSLPKVICDCFRTASVPHLKPACPHHRSRTRMKPPAPISAFSASDTQQERDRGEDRTTQSSRSRAQTPRNRNRNRRSPHRRCRCP